MEDTMSLLTIKKCQNPDCDHFTSEEDKVPCGICGIMVCSHCVKICNLCGEKFCSGEHLKQHKLRESISQG